MAGCRRLGAAAAARSCAYATCWASCRGGRAPAHSARGGPSPPSAPFGAAGPPHRAPQLNDPRRAAAAAPRPSRCKISAARGGGRAQGLRSPLIASASACRGAEAPFKSGSGGWVAGGWAWSPRALGRRGEACCRLQIARMCVWVLPARLRDAQGGSTASLACPHIAASVCPPPDGPAVAGRLSESRGQATEPRLFGFPAFASGATLPADTIASNRPKRTPWTTCGRRQGGCEALQPPPRVVTVHRRCRGSCRHAAAQLSACTIRRQS